VKADRDQLFAEALVRYKKGEDWYKVPDSAVKEQEKRREADPWEDLIANWTTNKGKFTSSQIYAECLTLKPDKLTRQVQLRVGKIMRARGWYQSNTTVIGHAGKAWLYREK